MNTKKMISAYKKLSGPKKYIYAGVLLVVVYLFWGPIKALINKLKTAASWGDAKSVIANIAGSSGSAVDQYNKANVGESVNKSRVEGAVPTLWECFHWYNDDEDRIISTLNQMANGSEVAYLSQLFQDRYGESLRAKVTGNLSNGEMMRVKPVVQTNWF